MRPARNGQLAQYMNVSRMTIHRWKETARLATPKSMVVNGIEYNDLDEWDAWLKARAVSRVRRNSEPSRNETAQAS
jgi:hypothetical protein